MTALQLEGKVAVVTGASSGIGEATARALARAGMTVVAAARRGDRLAQLAAEDRRIVARVTDVTQPSAVAALAEFVTEELGACHVLVNNAGASFGDRLRSPDDLTEFQRTMELNVTGAVRCMLALRELLFASAPARVVNVASVAGKLGVGPPAYVASKFALVGLSEATNSDWRRKGVTVTQLNPGFIATEQFPQDSLRRSPLTRWMVGKPEAVAAAVVDVVRHGRPERTVPRWYRSLVVLRHVAAPVYWAATARGGRR